MFAACGTNTAVELKAKVSRQHVLQGWKVKYCVKVRNIGVDTLTGLGLRVILPPQTEFVESKVFPALEKRSTFQKPSVNGTAVTWSTWSTLAPGKARKFSVKTRTGALTTGELVFQSYVYQSSSPVIGRPYCRKAANNVTVRLRRNRGGARDEGGLEHLTIVSRSF